MQNFCGGTAHPTSRVGGCRYRARRGADVTSVPSLRADQARRIALAAQGFADPRPAGRVDARHIRRVLDRIAILQIDSVNVFSRSHYLPVFARLGPYPHALLDRMTGYVPRPTSTELFEYWAHAASLVPVQYHPLLRWRMERAHIEPWQSIRRIAAEQPTLMQDVLRLVTEQGPVVAGDTGIPRPARTPGQMWNWHDGKTALEHLFYAGRVTTAKRVNFERYYDLTERVLPPEILAIPDPERGRRPARARPHLGAGARRRDPRRPARLLPALGRRHQARHRRPRRHR